MKNGREKSKFFFLQLFFTKKQNDIFFKTKKNIDNRK